MGIKMNVGLYSESPDPTINNLKTFNMKNLFLLPFGYVCMYILNQNPHSTVENISPTASIKNEFPIRKPALCIVFYQDVSGSIKQNGVEIVSSSVFSPIFKDIDRNIELHFGIIYDLTAGKLISLSLPARNFTRPILQDLRTLSITEKRRAKQCYINSEKQYISDSVHFYSDRNQRIADFRNKVDLRLSPYRSKLSAQTDLTTAVDIADRVFSHSVFGSANNYLLLNSDGMDSYKNKVSPITNKARVILINAGKNQSTSIDPIITLRLESPEQAIHYSLTN